MTEPAADTAAVSLGISIVTFHPDLALLSRTLNSLRAALALLQRVKPVQALLTIIDNGGSADHVARIVRDSGMEAITHIIANPHNVGFGTANNQAIRTSNAEFHLILNPDVELAA